jgi:predicted nuclease of predicted toxin-antitoxin system
VNCVVDAQLPPALARMLTEQGHTACHVEDLGLRHSDDNEIWQWALSNNAIIFTKDEDFPRRALVGRRAPVIVWLRVGNTSRRALLAWIKPLLIQIEAEVARGESIIEVR